MILLPRNNLTYRNVILSEGNYGGLPVGYWPMDEVNGTNAADFMAIARGTGHAGTITGGVTLGQTGPIAREQSLSMLFDGSSGVVGLGSGATLGGNAAQTLEVWAKASSGAASSEIFAFNDANIAATTIRLYYTGTQYAASRVKQNIADQSIFWTPPDSGWHHLVATFSGSVCTLYGDGSAITTFSYSGGGFGLANSNGSIGASYNNGGLQRYFKGATAHAAYYAYALAADRSKYRYLAGTVGVAGYGQMRAA